MTLHLPGTLVVPMIEHALREHPTEACGLLVGPADGLAVEHWPMLNALDSQTRWAFDPDAELAAYARLDQLGWEPLVVYHSHTAAPAVPSRTDIEFARYADPSTRHVIIGTADVEPTMRAWRLRPGPRLDEVPIEITEAAA